MIGLQPCVSLHRVVLEKKAGDLREYWYATHVKNAPRSYFESSFISPTKNDVVCYEESHPLADFLNGGVRNIMGLLNNTTKDLVHTGLFVHFGVIFQVICLLAAPSLYYMTT